MGSRKGILGKLFHYKVFQIFGLAAIFFISAFFVVFPLLEIFEFNLTQTEIYVLVYGIFAAVLAYYIFSQLRTVFYSDKTGGRIYSKDHGKYKRTYYELIDYFKDADVHILDTDSFSEVSWKEAEGIMFGTSGKKLISLSSDAEANIFVAGAPGSRKTTGVAIPTCSQHGGSVLAIDIKGDIYNFCSKKRNILRFCPDLKSSDGSSLALEYSCHFNPFAGISEMDDTEKKLYLGNMAMTLIPDEQGSDGNYFSSRARKMFLGIVHYLIDKKPDISFPEVLHAILHKKMPEGIEMKALPMDIFEWITAITQGSCTAAIEQVSSLFGNNEKNISGAFDCLVTALTPFSNSILDVLLDGEGRCISKRSLEDGYDVYLQISQENLDIYAPLFTMILSSFMTEFTKRPDTSTGVKNRPILILMDEMPQLTFSYSMLNSALSTLRSKSVQCMLIAQSVAQLSYKYPNDGWRALLGNCTYQLILKSNEELTQKHFSSLFGTKKVLKISNSDTYSKEKAMSRTVQEAREPVLQPEDFGDLTDNLYIYFDGKRGFAKKIFCYE